MQETADVFFHDLFSLIGDIHLVAINNPVYQGSFRGQGRIIYLLANHPGLAQREIANLAHIKPGSLTEVLDRLERGNLIIRKRDEKDRRIWHVSLTKEGHQTYEQLVKQRHEFEQTMLAGITHEEQEKFIQMIAKLRSKLEQNYGKLLVKKKGAK